jgi:hypothetical protein
MDVISCDSFPDGVWDYLHDSRLRFQNELKQFFLDNKGKMWIKLFKVNISKEEAKRIEKELIFG